MEYIVIAFRFRHELERVAFFTERYAESYALNTAESLQREHEGSRIVTHGAWDYDVIAEDGSRLWGIVVQGWGN